MADQYRTVGGKQIPLVTPKRMLIVDRLPGGKYGSTKPPIVVDPPAPAPELNLKAAHWLKQSSLGVASADTAVANNFLLREGWLTSSSVSIVSSGVALSEYLTYGYDSGFMASNFALQSSEVTVQPAYLGVI